VVVSRDLLLFVNSLVESSRVECTPTILISNIPGNYGYILSKSTELVSSWIQYATAK
jgi:hypothetical protein